MLALITFIVGSIVLIIALLMLLRQAFRASMLWGVLGILFAVPLYVFAALRWSELSVRKPVYFSLVGILAVFVSVSGGALQHLPFVPEHEVIQSIEENIAPPKETPLPNEEAAQAVEFPEGDAYDPLLKGGEFEPIELKDVAPPVVQQALPKATSEFQAIDIAEVERAINRRVKLQLANGEQIEGVLTHLQDGSMVVESKVAGGEVGYSYAFDEVDSLSVLDPAPVSEESPEQVVEQAEAATEEAIEQVIEQSSEQTVKEALE